MLPRAASCCSFSWPAYPCRRIVARHVWHSCPPCLPPTASLSPPTRLPPTRCTRPSTSSRVRRRPKTVDYLKAQELGSQRRPTPTRRCARTSRSGRRWRRTTTSRSMAAAHFPDNILTGPSRCSRECGMNTLALKRIPCWPWGDSARRRRLHCGSPFASCGVGGGPPVIPTPCTPDPTVKARCQAQGGVLPVEVLADTAMFQETIAGWHAAAPPTRTWPSQVRVPRRRTCRETIGAGIAAKDRMTGVNAVAGDEL